MADESSTVQDQEVEPPEATEPEKVEVAEEETPETPEADASEEGEEGEEEAPEEEVEYDFGGGQKVKFKANATAKEVFEHAQKAFKDVEGSYTRKGQEVAELRKSLEAREKVVEKLTALNDEALNTYSRGLSVRQELEQLEQIDVNSLWQSNPDQARRVSDAISAKRAEFQNIVTKVNQLEGHLNQTQQAEIARRMDEGKQVIEKRIPGFATKHLPDVIEYVSTNYGIPKEIAARDWPLNPDTAQMAYKAMMYDRMQAQAKKAAKTPNAPNQPQPIVPMKGKGGSAVRKDPSKMDMDEYARWRAAGGG